MDSGLEVVAIAVRRNRRCVFMFASLYWSVGYSCGRKQVGHLFSMIFSDGGNNFELGQLGEVGLLRVKSLIHSE
jgi:hypothetical protein